MSDCCYQSNARQMASSNGFNKSCHGPLPLGNACSTVLVTIAIKMASKVGEFFHCRVLIVALAAAGVTWSK